MIILKKFNYTIQYVDGDNKGLCIEDSGDFEDHKELETWMGNVNVQASKGLLSYKVISIDQ